MFRHTDSQKVEKEEEAQDGCQIVGDIPSRDGQICESGLSDAHLVLSLILGQSVMHKVGQSEQRDSLRMLIVFVHTHEMCIQYFPTFGEIMTDEKNQLSSYIFLQPRGIRRQSKNRTQSRHLSLKTPLKIR